MASFHFSSQRAGMGVSVAHQWHAPALACSNAPSASGTVFGTHCTVPVRQVLSLEDTAQYSDNCLRNSTSGTVFKNRRDRCQYERME